MRVLSWEFRKVFLYPWIILLILMCSGFNVYLADSLNASGQEIIKVSENSRIIEQFELKTVGDVIHNKDRLPEDFTEQFMWLADKRDTPIALGEGSDVIVGLLLGIVCRGVFVESMIISLLLTLFLGATESVSLMKQMIYSARTGRNIIFMKLLTVISVSILGTVLNMVLSVVLFVRKFEVKNLLYADISSPFISYNVLGIFGGYNFRDMRVLTYLFWVLGLITAISVIFTLTIFALCMFFNNFYLGSGVTVLLMGIDYTVTSMGAEKIRESLSYLTQMSIFRNFFLLPAWYTDYGGIYKGGIAEIRMLWVWLMLACICFVLGYGRFISSDN